MPKLLKTKTTINQISLQLQGNGPPKTLASLGVGGEGILISSLILRLSLLGAELGWNNL